jgi:hypothetical protein
VADVFGSSSVAVADVHVQLALERFQQAAAELRVAAQVGRRVAGELDAAGADESYLDHSSLVFHSSDFLARYCTSR